jgi:sugar lactone lactonase YvrE
MNVGGSLSTLGNVFIAKELYTTSSILTRGTISTLQNVNVGSNIVVACNAEIGGTLNVVGGVAFNNINTSTLNVNNTITVLSSMVVGGALNVNASTIMRGIVNVLSNVNVTGFLSTTSNIIGGDSLIVANDAFFGLNVSTTTITASNGTFNRFSSIGPAAFYSSVRVQGSISVFSSIAATNIHFSGGLFNNGIRFPGGSENGVFSTLSTVGQVAFYSSVQIQGSLSVFSSIAATDVNFTGGLYSNGILFTGGSGSPTFSTISTIGEAAFYSSVQVQGSLSVFSSIAATDVNFTGGLYSNGILFTGGSGSPTFSTISTVGQGAFYSSVQIQGGLSVFSTIGTVGLSVQCNATIGGTLGVGGITTLSNTSNTGTLGVAGVTTLTNTGYDSLVVNGGVWVKGKGISVYATTGSYDVVNESPWYGIGAATKQLGGYVVSSVQVAGYAGINFVTGGPNASYGSDMAIVSNKVGIANINPQTTLDVSGSFNVTGQTSLANTSNTGTLRVSGSATMASNLSTVGQAAFFSNVQVQGSVSVFSTITAYNINFTSSITSNGLPFSSGVPLTSSFAQVALPLAGSRGICFDLAGNMYVGDTINNVVYKITPQGETSLIAGTAGTNLFIDGSGSSALSQVWNMCFDVYSGWIMIGTIRCIRAVNPATGQVITLCGSSTTTGNSNNQTGTAATFDLISGICSDGNGNLYITDFNNNNVSRISFNLPITANGGTKTIIAGSTAAPGVYGYYNNSTGTNARFANPSQLVVNLNKTLLWVTDSANNVIRQLSLSSPFAVTTFAGPVGSSATPGNQVLGTPGHVDQSGSANAGAVRFNNPYGIAIDGSNNLYVVEYAGRYLRFINTASFYTHTLAGNGTSANTSGSGANGTMAGPTSVALDPYGNPWIVTYDTPAIFNYNMQTGYLSLYYTPTGAPPTPDTLRNTTVSTMLVPAIATQTLFGSGFTSFNAGVTYVSPQGLIMDSQNNLYVSDKFKIRKVTPSRFVTSIFGDPSNIQNANQPFPGAQGEYNGSYQMCIDNSGNLYIANAGTSTINVVNLITGAASNLAPTGQALNNCFGVLFKDGFLYVSNTNILATPPAGYLVAINLSTNASTLLAGSTTVGALTNSSGTAARFNFIYGMCFDISKNNILICDRGNGAIRNYNISSTAVTTYSTGVTLPSFIAADTLGNYYATSGSTLFKIVAGTATSFSSGFADVFGITVDSYNNIYVSDVTNNCIYFITAGGTLSVYSGNAGSSGTQDSLYASTLSLLTPYVGINKSNAQYTMDVGGSVNFTGGLYSNGILFSGGSGSTFSTLTAVSINFTSSITSNGLPFTSGVSATSGFAQVGVPLANSRDICFDPSGNMYVADASNNVIYKINPQGVTSLLAGNYGVSGWVDGTGSAAVFTQLSQLIWDPYTQTIVVATNYSIRSIHPVTGVVVTIAGSGTTGNAPGTGIAAGFGTCNGVCGDGSGNFYITDNNCVKKVSITSSTSFANTGVMTIVAGSTATISGYTNATGTSARFTNPNGIVINSGKTLLWVADQTNNVIRQITLPGYVVTTLAGALSSPPASSIDSTTATSVTFNSPVGIAIDASNNLFITEYGSHKLRFINTGSFYTLTLAGSTAGTVAGVGANSQMNQPYGIALDPYGSLWITTLGAPTIFNYSIQTGYLSLFYQASATTSTPNSLQNTPVSTIIVPAMAATTLYGAGFTAFNSSVTYVSPQGLLMDSQNNLYVSDKFKMRKVAPSGFVTSIFGDPSNTQNADKPFPGVKGEYNGSFQMCFDNSGNMYIADPGTSTIHVITLATGAVSNLVITGQALNNCLGILFNAGTLYVSNTNILASPPAGYLVAINLSTNVSTLIAGSSTLGALTNGNGTAARFNYIYGICFDVAKANILICDRGNTAIRNYNISTTAVTTYSTGVALPSFIAADSLGNYYATSGTALYKVTAGTANLFSSGFSYVLGITLDVFNNIYVSDLANNCIYFINPAGTSSVYSGIAGSSGTQDSLYASTVSIVAPYVGINKSNAQYTLDVGGSVNFTAGLYSNGILFSGGTSSFSTLNAYTINFTSSITSNGLPFTSGVSATSGFAQIAPGQLPLTNSCGICFDPSGNMYVADFSKYVIYKITPTGVISLLAGTYGLSGLADGIGSSALFGEIWNICYDSFSGCIMVASVPAIRAINLTTGQVTTLAGSIVGSANGTGASASFNKPAGICSDGAGALYIADCSNNNIRKLTYTLPITAASGVVTLFCGNATASGYTNATGASAAFNAPSGIVINSAKTLLWVTDTGNHVIRQITLPGAVATTFAGANAPTVASGYVDSAVATSVRFNSPQSLAIDASNNLFVVEYLGDYLRFINTSAGSFYTQTLAGNGSNTNASGVGRNASMAGPCAVAFDPYGNPWIVSYDIPAIFNYNVLTGYLNLFFQASATTSTPNSLQNSPISTIIVPAMAATTIFGSDFTSLNTVVTYLSPQGLVMDSQNNLFVSDKFKIRRVAPSGFVRSVFGDPSNTQDGNQPVPGAKGQFNGSYQMCFDNSGNLYIADPGTSTVHVVNVVTGAVSNLAPTGQTIGNCYGVLFNAGILYVSNTNMTASPPAGYIVAVNLATNVGTLIAGSTTLGALTNANGTSARFNFIYGMCFDVAKANIFICDRGNSVIRQYNISTTAVTTYCSAAASCIASDSLGNYYATGGTALFKIVGGTATSFSSGFSFVLGVTVDSFNNIYVSDIINNCIYMINAGGIATVYSGIAGITGTQDSVYGSTISLLTPYVGINKSNAQYNLDVGGSINFSGGLYSNGSLFFAANTPNMTLSTLSTLGQAAFNSNVQVRGSLSVFSSISAYNMNATGMNVNTLTANTGFAQITGMPLLDSYGMCFDPSGNLYVGDHRHYVVYKITPQGVTSVLAGTFTVSGYADGTGSAALFTIVWSLIYDTYTSSIVVGTATVLRSINPVTGRVVTIAGTATAGNTPGVGTNCFGAVNSVCSDGAGNFYVSDNNYFSIKKVTITSPTSFAGTGNVSIIAGGSSGYTNNATGTSASFAGLRGIALNVSKTSIYACDAAANGVIRSISLTPPYAVGTLVGAATANASASSTDSTTSTSVTFGWPQNLAVDANNNLFIVDNSNNTLRFVALSGGTFSYSLTLAGTGVAATTNLSGVGKNASLVNPGGVTIDSTGTPWFTTGTGSSGAIFNYNINTGYANLFYQNTNASVAALTPPAIQNTAISTITAPAIATGTLYGSGFTITNGNSANIGGATYTAPNGVAVDSQNNIYVCDQYKIRKITPSGLVTSVYGDPANTQNTTQAGTGATGVSSNLFQSICFDTSGNMYVSQNGTNSILRINLTTGVGIVLTFSGQALNGPNGILFNNNILYVINENKGGSGFTTGAAYVVAINLATNVSVIVAGSISSTAIFNGAFSMCFDSTKTNIYVSNFNAGNIRIIANFANTGSYPITPTTFTTSGVSITSFVYITSDSIGNFYLTGGYSGMPVSRGIIKITSAGVASSFANTVTYNAATLNLNTPQALSVDSYNNVYFADQGLKLVGIISPSGTATSYSGFNSTTGTQDSTYASSITLMAPYVGINTANPTATLDVNGTLSVSGSGFTGKFTTNSYIQSTDNINRLYCNTNGDTNFGIKNGGSFYFQNNVSGNVAYVNGTSGTFNVLSDQRIKKNIVTTTDALDIINQINIVKYDYIHEERGSVKHGIIAQELQQVYPDAVGTIRNVIPSHLTVVDFDLEGSNTVLIKCSTAHDLIVNDTVKLDIGDTYSEKVILEVPSDTTFIVSVWDNFSATSSVSLYGKYVDDFLSYDKAQIGILAAGACKTLSGQVSTLQSDALNTSTITGQQASTITGLEATIASILQKYPL